MTREEAIERLCAYGVPQDEKRFQEALDMAIEALQEVQKHKKTFEWCHDCKEYDTDNHCCHRWSKVIRNTVGELKAEESVTLYATPKATYVRPLTEEIAIEFLQDSGWLPNHDKAIGNPSMLVRCKDCRRNNDGNLCDIAYYINEDGDGFCNCGERREE